MLQLKTKNKRACKCDAHSRRKSKLDLHRKQSVESALPTIESKTPTRMPNLFSQGYTLEQRDSSQCSVTKNSSQTIVSQPSRQTHAISVLKTTSEPRLLPK